MGMSLDDILGSVTKITDAIRTGAQTYDVMMGETTRTVGTSGGQVEVTEPPKTTGVDTATSTAAAGLLTSAQGPILLILLAVLLILALK